MLKKPRKVSKATLQRKADRLLQEAFRKVYKTCEICGKPMACAHHVFPKSMSSNLRYDWDNLVAICHGCHFRHHNGDPTIHAVIMKKRGKAWYSKLLKKKQTIAKTDEAWYLGKIGALQAING